MPAPDSAAQDFGLDGSVGDSRHDIDTSPLLGDEITTGPDHETPLKTKPSPLTSPTTQNVALEHETEACTDVPPRDGSVGDSRILLGGPLNVLPNASMTMQNTLVGHETDTSDVAEVVPGLYRTVGGDKLTPL